MVSVSSIIRSFGNFFFLHIMTRWVAGGEAEDAIAYCRKLQEKGSSGIVNYLGEHYKESTLADATVKEYKHLIDLINTNGLRSSITIKPSQFGFSVLDVEDPKSLCEQNMLEIVQYSYARGVPVWLDMESSDFTDFTIEFYRKYSRKLNLGICLQANLKRTDSDLDELFKLANKGQAVKVRLVKGIYVENDQISIRDQSKLHSRFLKLITYVFEKSPKNFGFAVGTHHSEAIDLAVKLQSKYNKAFFEIEVLKGVLPGYYEEIRKRKVPLSEYIPYGKDAFAYSVRRARKNPGFAKSMLFSLFFDAYKKLYG